MIKPMYLMIRSSSLLSIFSPSLFVHAVIAIISMFVTYTRYPFLSVITITSAATSTAASVASPHRGGLYDEVIVVVIVVVVIIINTVVNIVVTISMVTSICASEDWRSLKRSAMLSSKWVMELAMEFAREASSVRIEPRDCMISGFQRQTRVPPVSVYPTKLNQIIVHLFFQYPLWLCLMMRPDLLSRPA